MPIVQDVRRFCIKASCLLGKSDISGLSLHSGIQPLRKQNVSSLLTPKDSVLWGASVTESSVLGFRPPGLVFRIRYLEGSVISFISLSSVSCPGPV